MYVRCYSTHSSMDVQEQLWAVLRSKGWFGCGPVTGINYFYIPEHLESWCLIIDPTLKRYPKKDWIV